MSLQHMARHGRWLLLLALLLAPTLGTKQSHAVGARPPVLAFYYTWYHPSTFTVAQMSDLPVKPYESGAPATIDRQLRQASGAGITGFISSWWGPGDPSDKNFALLLARSATLKRVTGRQFSSTIYLETDAPSLGSTQAIEQALRYVAGTYARNPYFFHWQGKPVVFIWDPLGHGRTLATWAAIRRDIDPTHATIWSAEGTDLSMLAVFDGLHLFSAAYWAVLDGSIASADAGFRARIDAYNAVHGTQRIWAAGVLPGYDDTRVPGRTGTYIVPRHNGMTYRLSWRAALASHPDWITITTFNEWFEGAMIEPSIHYGNLYLSITREFTSG
jgi:hypothetical protein